MTILHVQNPQSNDTLASHSKRDAKWDKHRGNAQVIGSHYEINPQYARLAERIAGCSTSLGFATSTDTSSGEISLKLRSAMFCKVRACPVCAWRRSLKNTSRFFAAVPALQEKFPSHRWLFLTLTVRNCEPDQLRETIKAMNAGWQRLIQRKDWPAVGFARATEITRNEQDGTAHPHFHVMMMVKASYFSHGYITQAEWAERWKQAMRLDYTPVIDIQAVKSKKDGETLQAAVVETLKYATKAEDAIADPEWLYMLTGQLHRMRFLATGGALKDVLRNDMSNEEMIHGDDTQAPTPTDDAPSIWFGWNPKARQYIKCNK